MATDSLWEHCMSVQSRIKDAEIAWQGGLKEKALLAALSAANDTARRRYPQAKDGREAMSHFIADISGQLTGGTVDQFDWSFRGGTTLGEVLHDVYRTLLDTGKMPADLELVSGKEFEVQVLEGNRRAYCDCLVPRLINAVKQAPENRTSRR